MEEVESKLLFHVMNRLLPDLSDVWVFVLNLNETEWELETWFLMHCFWITAKWTAVSYHDNSQIICKMRSTFPGHFKSSNTIKGMVRVMARAGRTIPSPDHTICCWVRLHRPSHKHHKAATSGPDYGHFLHSYCTHNQLLSFSKMAL